MTKLIMRVRDEAYLLLMKAKSVVSCKSFMADVTFVWFHARMQFDMLFKIMISEVLTFTICNFNSYLT